MVPYNGFYEGDCKCLWTRDGPFTRFCSIHSKDRIKELEKRVEELEQKLRETNMRKTDLHEQWREKHFKEVKVLEERIKKLKRPDCNCDSCIERRICQKEY